MLLHGALLILTLAASKPEANVFYTRSPVVEIPFHSVDSGPAGVASADLYVCLDEGKDWKKVGRTDRLTPTDSGKVMAGKFTFYAQEEGRYGFDIVATDRAGNIEPGPDQVALVVVVDTSPPQLEIRTPLPKARIRRGETVPVAWSYQDISPAREFVLMARQTQPSTQATADWTELAQLGPDARRYDWSTSGLAAGVYELKLMARDVAENLASTTLALHVETPTATAPAPAGQPTIRANAPTPAAPPPAAPTTRKTPPTPQTRAARAPVCAPPTQPVAPVASPAPSAAPPPPPSPVMSLRTSPGSARRAFHIDYQIDRQGPSGIGYVDLYYTTDGGATWARYGRDWDGKPPIIFYAQSDGVYGFNLVAASGSGVAGEPPAPGTKPTFITRVDTSFPSLMLNEPRGGESYRPGQQITIRWTASDDNFGPMPISLEATTDAGATWQLIGGPMANTGRFTWTLPGTVGCLRLRAVAEDAVGNRTVVETGSDIVVDNTLPAVRIRSLRASRQVDSPAEPVRAERGEPRDNAAAKRLLAAARSFMHQQRYSEAARAFDLSLGRLGDEVSGRVEYGYVLLKLGRTRDAMRVLDAARAMAPNHARANYLSAVGWLETGDTASAQRAALTAARAEPEAAGNWLVLAKVYHLRANDEEAAACCRKVLALKGAQQEKALAQSFLEFLKKRGDAGRD